MHTATAYAERAAHAVASIRPLTFATTDGDVLRADRLAEYAALCADLAGIAANGQPSVGADRASDHAQDAAILAHTIRDKRDSARTMLAAADTHARTH